MTMPALNVLPGEGRPTHKPEPTPFSTGTITFLLTVPTICFIFLLWRRASALRGVVSHQLQTWSRRDGRIRLSTDDGPPAAEFLEDDYDDDNTGLTIEESLAVSRSELSLNPAAHTSTHHLLLLPDDRSLANATSVWSDNSEGHEVPESPPK